MSDAEQAKREQQLEALRKLKADGMTFTRCIEAFGQSADESPYIGAAQALYAADSDDDIEVDPISVVSVSENGAFVLMWGWVPIAAIDGNEEEEAEARQRYSPKQIARELMATALGEAYHGNALYVAKDIPVLTDEERWVLLRWLDGSQCGSDWRELQMIAQKVAADA